MGKESRRRLTGGGVGRVWFGKVCLIIGWRVWERRRVKGHWVVRWMALSVSPQNGQGKVSAKWRVRSEVASELWMRDMVGARMWLGSLLDFAIQLRMAALAESALGGNGLGFGGRLIGDGRIGYADKGCGGC